MAILAFLTAASGYSLLFQRRILDNLAYWQGYVAARASDPAALDRELERILNALRFGLEHRPGWPVAYQLIGDLAPHMERRGHWDNWNRILTRAIEVAGEGQEQEQVLDLSGLLARLLYRQSRFNESVAVYRRVIRLAQQLGQKYDEGRACTNLGFYYVEQGRFYRAEVLCCHALTIFKQIENQHGLAHTHNHLGVLYTRQGDWAKAQDHLDHACAIWQMIGDEHGLMRVHSNLGFLFNEMGHPDDAILHLKVAIKKAELVREEVIRGVSYMNIGSAYRLKGEWSESEVNFRRAETIFREFSSLNYLADLQEDLSIFYLDQQNWVEVKWRLENALEIWRMLGNQYGEIRTTLHLVKYELAREDYSGAKSWLKEAKELLHRYDLSGRYWQLHQQVNEFCRSLSDY